MLWYDKAKLSHLIALATRASADEALGAAEVFASLRQVKTASKSEDLHLYVDPRFAGKYKINLHMIEQNDRERNEEDQEPSPSVKTAKAVPEDEDEFQETTVSFVSKKTSDPNYLCTIVLQKPEGKVWSVSAYLMETYLGRYAFRANFYFKKENSRSARKCYARVSRAIREMRQDVIEDDILQNAVPRLMRKRLSSIEGEVEPRINKMATYLNPDNAVEPVGPESSPATYIPNKRSVTDDLMLEE